MAEYLDQQQTNHTDLMRYFVVLDYYEGQTFKAGLSGNLTTVKLWLEKYGTPDNLTVEIQGTVWNALQGCYLPDNNVLASEQISESSINTSPGNEITIVFSTPTSVVANSRYSIVLHQEGDYSNYYSVLGARYFGDLYTDGKYMHTDDAGANWYKYGDLDCYFKTYVTVNEEIYDINNDFRIAGQIIDINNDFRAFQTEVKMNIDNDFRSVIEVLGDIDNKFTLVKEQITNFLNNFVFSYEGISNIINIFIMVKDSIIDMENDFRTKKETRYEVNNDFRMLSPWQVPQAGEVGFQSAGKSEVKVYINSVEQTDADVNSITWTENLNAPWVASFNLGRAYDDSKPTIGTSVEIKYKGILLYKGYITEINPTDSPESIRIDCQNEYWNLNKTKKYFLVGRKPIDTKEYYYETIGQALSALGFSYGIGSFIPQPIDLYGNGTADAISGLVQECGNFNWFIDVNGNKRLWQAGAGNIINLEQQELGKNLGLYQVIKHNIRESIVGIINKFRVQMGNKTTRPTSEVWRNGTGEKDYDYTYTKYLHATAVPAWDKSLEVLAKKSSDGYGWDYQDPDKDYTDVFRKFFLPQLSVNDGQYSDKRPPLVAITEGTPHMYYNLKYTKEGFTIDYENQKQYGEFEVELYGYKPTIIFSEPQVLKTIDENGDLSLIQAKNIAVHLCKDMRVTYRDDESPDQSNPDEEPTETRLMFYTDKIGDYSETIIDTLNLSGLSVQEGYTIYDYAEVPVKKWVIDVWGKLVVIETTEIKKIIIEKVPSWDDTEFARDVAYWQLNKKCDKKINGTMDLTIDAILYYGIDLSKRIQISNVVNPVNITSITYNFNSFIATVSIEKTRYYKRSVNYPYHGE